MNLAEFQRCVKGYERRLKTQADIIDTLNHTFGHYIISAIHEPKKYPKEPDCVAEKKRKATISTTDESRAARAKRLYGKRKDGNRN